VAEDGFFRDAARIFLDEGATRQRRYSAEANRAFEQIAPSHGIAGWFGRSRLVFSRCTHGDSVSPKALSRQRSDPFDAPTKPCLSGGLVHLSCGKSLSSGCRMNSSRSARSCGVNPCSSPSGIKDFASAFNALIQRR